MYQISLNRAEKIKNLVLELVGNSEKFTSVKYSNTVYENIKHRSNEDCSVFLSRGMQSVEYYPNYKFENSEFFIDVQLFSYTRKNKLITLRNYNSSDKEIIDIDDFNEELYFQYRTVYEQPVLDALVLFKVFHSSDVPYFTCWLDQMEEIEDAIRRTTILD